MQEYLVSDDSHSSLSDHFDKSSADFSDQDHETPPKDIRSCEVTIPMDTSSSTDLYTPLKFEEYDENQLADFFREHVPSFLLDTKSAMGSRGGRSIRTAADSSYSLAVPRIGSDVDHMKRRKMAEHRRELFDSPSPKRDDYSSAHYDET